MSKSAAQPDVLVLGQHPCAYLAATVLLAKPALSVAHACIPGEHAPDRLVIVNPELFELFPLLGKQKKKLQLAPVWGVRFIADDQSAQGEFRAKSAVACVGSYAEIRKRFAECAKDAGARHFAGERLSIERVDERGFEVVIDGQTIRPKAILLGGELRPENGSKMLGLPDPWAADVMRRYSFVRFKNNGHVKLLGNKPVIPMSLNLRGGLSWAWLLPGEDEIQLAVEQALDSIARNPTADLLRHWLAVLQKHGLVDQVEMAAEQVQFIDVPAAGALNREPIGNRTLLFGPAGGFYTACLEDIYPNCWSALFAAEAVRAALKEPHLQDALQPYREKWGITLGDYLRGPQQNLRFLLPLVYRNPVMTNRLGESILLGKSVVR